MEKSKVCPYLGKSKANPNQMLCGKLKPASPIRTSYIKDYCLADYEQCSIYQGAPGRQSAGERSPLVVVPVAPAQREPEPRSRTAPPPAPGKMPNVEFMAYDEAPAEPEPEKRDSRQWWVVLMLLGIIIAVALAAMIVFQFI